MIHLEILDERSGFPGVPLRHLCHCRPGSNLDVVSPHVEPVVPTTTTTDGELSSWQRTGRAVLKKGTRTSLSTLVIVKVFASLFLLEWMSSRSSDGSSLSWRLCLLPASARSSSRWPATATSARRRRPRTPTTTSTFEIKVQFMLSSSSSSSSNNGNEARTVKSCDDRASKICKYQNFFFSDSYVLQKCSLSCLLN